MATNEVRREHADDAETERLEELKEATKDQVASDQEASDKIDDAEGE